MLITYVYAPCDELAHNQGLVINEGTGYLESSLVIKSTVGSYTEKSGTRLRPVPLYRYQSHHHRHRRLCSVISGR